MIVPVMVISNLGLTRQIYSEETDAHYREPVPLRHLFNYDFYSAKHFCSFTYIKMFFY